MYKWRIGDRCIVTIPEGYPNNCHPKNTKDVLGHVRNIERKANGLPGNLYTIQLDHPIRYYGGEESVLLEYTSRNMRPITGGLH